MLLRFEGISSGQLVTALHKLIIINNSVKTAHLRIAECWGDPSDRVDPQRKIID